MSKVHGRSVVLVVMAAVFTVGLMFATMELPYLADSLLQRVVTTPGLDSHADATSRLKTEMFIGHYHLRVIGYACFGLTVLLIIIGFVTKKSGWAAFGAVASSSSSLQSMHTPK